MKNTETYNGWTNYETWLVMLWIDNGGRDYIDELARNVLDDTERDHAVYPLACMLEEQTKDEAGDVVPNAGLMSDLLNASLSHVNWSEIARHIIDDIED